MRPGPGFIALCTILVSACLTIFLLSITGGITQIALASSGSGPASGENDQEQVAAAEEKNAAAEDNSVTVNEASVRACAVSERFPASILQWCEIITQYAEKHNLPPDLVAALIWQESGGNPQAYSRSGAVGLMQVMPSDGLAASFMCQNGPCFGNRPRTEELKDPEFNFKYVTRMLAGLVSKNGDLREALKSYGPMNVGYYYADKVMGIFERYRK